MADALYSDAYAVYCATYYVVYAGSPDVANVYIYIYA